MSGANQPAWDLHASTKSSLYESLGCSAVGVTESKMNASSSYDTNVFRAEQNMQNSHNFSRPNCFQQERSVNAETGMYLPHQQGSSEMLRNSLNTAGFKSPTNSLWLGALDPISHSKEELRNFFHGWQGFLDVYLPETGGNFGFARFETPEDAMEAKNFIARRLHLVVCGKPIKVNFGRQMSTARPNADAAQEAPRLQENFSNRSGLADMHDEPHMASSSKLAVIGDDENRNAQDSFMNETIEEFEQQEHVVHQDVTYYEDPEGTRQLGRNDIDEIVGKVDRVRRNSGKEELRDCMKRKRSKARELIQIITKRIFHLYSHDTHKKLMILYSVGDFFYTLPPHRRYDVGAMIGEEIVEFLSTVLAYQCDKGKTYVSDVAASLYFYFVPSTRKMMEVFIDIEPLIELKQEVSSTAE
ncbi:hypothetical protein XU18_1527 [Perkinsela sp. CCAP 1560/4]|nr:hypothetical protein XU18_1527 [Perkinsela sp. CCAP 1560/4]|eukprot:KNH07850.1 hypothetical protein XU18_1527 [Perkinsela sp. CCAP 1560/4]